MRRKKSSIVVTMLLVFILSFPTIAVAAPKIELAGTNLHHMSVGDSKVLTVSLKNNGTSTARDMQISVISSTMESCDVLEYGSTLASNDVMLVELDATAPSSSGRASITLLVGYYDELQRPNNTELTFYVDVSGTDGQTSASKDPVILLQNPTGLITMKTGEKRRVELEIANTSTGGARNFTLFVAPNENLSVSLLEGADRSTTISGKSTKTFPVSITTPHDLEAGSYPVQFKYTCEASNERQISGELSFYVRIEDSDTVGKPNILIKNFKAESTQAGEVFKIQADVVNTGDKKASNVQVALGGLDPTGINLYNDSGSAYFTSISPTEAQSFSTTLKSSQTINGGSHPITMKVSWYDEKNEVYTNEYTFYVTILGGSTDEDRGMVVITSLSSPLGQYGVGEKASIRMTIENRGTKTAKNIKISANSGEAVVPSSASVVTVPSLEPKASKSLDFSFSPNSTAGTQNYAIGFTVEYETGVYKDGEPLTDTFMQYTSINAYNPEKDDEEGKKSIPKIIVSHYRVEPEIVEAGQEFYLNISFQNTHKDKAISNIRATFSVIGTETEKGNVFTPVDSSNMFYIEEMMPKSISEHKLHLYTVPDAKPKNYVLTFKFEYEDVEGNPYESTMDVGINVAQQARFELGEVRIPEYMAVNEPVYLDFSVLNTGKVDLNNFVITIKGDAIDSQGAEMIFGTLVANSDDYYQGEFTPLVEGESTIQIIVSYHSDTGEKVEEEYEYTIHVDPAPNFDEPPMDEMPEGMGMEEEKSFVGSAMFWAVIGGSALILVIAGVIFYKKRKDKKKKLEEELDENL